MNTADHLTTAYVAKGIVEAMNKAPVPNALTRMAEEGTGGEDSFMQECIKHADTLEAAFTEELARSFYGLFLYDVAEPFGEWVAGEVLAGRTVTAEAAADKARFLIEEYVDL